MGTVFFDSSSSSAMCTMSVQVNKEAGPPHPHLTHMGPTAGRWKQTGGEALGNTISLWWGWRRAAPRLSQWSRRSNVNPNKRPHVSSSTIPPCVSTLPILLPASPACFSRRVSCLSLTPASPPCLPVADTLDPGL
ncbi:unnamed protein product [Boreogadus saida]